MCARTMADLANKRKIEKMVCSAFIKGYHSNPKDPHIEYSLGQLWWSHVIGFLGMEEGPNVRCV